MNYEEKAKELIDKYLHINRFEETEQGYYSNINAAKESAILALEFSKEFITGDLDEAFDKFLAIEEIKKQINKYE